MAYCITDFWSRGTFCTRFYLSWVDYSGGGNLSAYFNEPKRNYCVSGHQRGLTDTLWTIATRHWVYQLCPAFQLKEAVPGLLVTHICAELDFHSWPGRDPLPSLFCFSLSSRPGKKKCLTESFSTVTAKDYTSTRSPPPALWYTGEQTKPSGLSNFYSGTLLVCCRERRRNFLVRFFFCLMITGFPPTPSPWG